MIKHFVAPNPKHWNKGKFHFRVWKNNDGSLSYDINFFERKEGINASESEVREMAEKSLQKHVENI